MCEYYCDAVCMQNSNKEEKELRNFPRKVSNFDNTKTGLAIVQGLTNNGEKIQERVDRI